jgi:WW domain
MVDGNDDFEAALTALKNSSVEDVTLGDILSKLYGKLDQMDKKLDRLIDATPCASSIPMVFVAGRDVSKAAVGLARLARQLSGATSATCVVSSQDAEEQFDEATVLVVNKPSLIVFHGGEETTVNNMTRDSPQTNASEPSKLKPGWKEVIVPSSSDVYYYNSETGGTQWDPPLVGDENQENVNNQDSMSPGVEEPGQSAALESMPRDQPPGQELEDHGWVEVDEQNSD